MSDNHFLNAIKYLREFEEIILYDNQLEINEIESKQVIAYLNSSYQVESLDYPFEAPTFDPDAALWAAKTIYIACQILIHREATIIESRSKLEKYSGNITPSSIMSADLCLRFLPEIIQFFKNIDVEDPVIQILIEHLYSWHYSGISFALDTSKLEFETIGKSKCLFQQYVNRVIEYKKLILANHKALYTGVVENLGGVKNKLWNEFKLENV